MEAQKVQNCNLIMSFESEFIWFKFSSKNYTKTILSFNISEFFSVKLTQHYLMLNSAWL